MARTSPWPTMLGTAALLALPVLAAAQTSGAGSQTPPPPPPTQSNPTSATPPTGSATGETAQDKQPDASVARQHLTAARQSLADLTALPQAQQLQGETRTQVSQLISQFNQLITTETEWRSTYDQVNTTLNTLLNSPSSPSSSSTTGAVGTAGAGAAVDPAIRGKLEEFRTHLQAFYDAAGGNAADAPAGSAGASSEEVESHVAAIEQILDQAAGSSSSSAAAPTATGTSGTTTPSTPSPSNVTLTQQQIEQIRMHLQQLRGSLKK